MTAHPLDDLHRPDLVLHSGWSADHRREQYLYSADSEPTHRYAFARWWGSHDLDRLGCWVGLNPATGDTERRRRPTLAKMMHWTRCLGLDGLVVVNLFAYRVTDPRKLRAAQDPVGMHNDSVLAAVSSRTAVTVAAWGGSAMARVRAREVRPLLLSPLCLGTTARGAPRHPLYVPRRAKLVPLPETPDSLATSGGCR